MNNKHWQITFFGNVYDSTRASREAGRLIRQYMAEHKVDYKTATHELQGIVKNFSNEASFRSYAAQEPLIRRHEPFSRHSGFRTNG